jgi:hypothetical protein
MIASHLSQDEAADALLSRDPLALLLGMLLDQHMRQRSSGCSCERVRQGRPRRRHGGRSVGRWDRKPWFSTSAFGTGSCDQP